MLLGILRQQLKSTESQRHRTLCDCTGCLLVKLALKIDKIIIGILQLRKLQLIRKKLCFFGITVHHIITKTQYTYYRQLGLF